MSCVKPPSSSCKPVKHDSDTTLAKLVRSYQVHNRPDSINELEFFRNMPSIELAVYHASLAINGNNKRFSHQYRIPLTALKRAEALLITFASKLRGFNTFHELQVFLGDLLLSVQGLGELYVYDTALRLGSFLKLSPQYVYLHAGTRTGARALGLNVSEGFLSVSSLPKEIRNLAPHEIEDFLCIYKGHFDKGIPLRPTFY